MPTLRMHGFNLSDPAWRRVIGRYFLVIAPAHLIWEFAHMPLYTLWTEGTSGEIIFAAVHCAVGDWMIAATSLLLALILFGGPDWPRRRYVLVMVAAIVFALVYTVFSEWLNIEVRESWAYRDIMPRLPPLGTGLTPVLQWLVLPGIGSWWARRIPLLSPRGRKSSER